MIINVDHLDDGSVKISDQKGHTKILAPGILPFDIVNEIKSFQEQLPVTEQGDQRVTDVVRFGADYIAAIKSLVGDIETLRTLQDRVAVDSSLFPQYLSSPGARTDLTAFDLSASLDAVAQLLIAFDGGAPSQKAKLFKIL